VLSLGRLEAKGLERRFGVGNTEELANLGGGVVDEA
jgi:hypothetical protein